MLTGEPLESVFEQVRIGLAVCRLDGTAVRVNRALAEMTGRPEEELLARGMAHVTHPDDVLEEQRLWADLQAGRTSSHQLDKRLLRPDGTLLWCHVETSLLEDRDGGRGLVLSQVQDISSRKAAEDELTRLAMHDGLTGLPNRALLLDRLAQALARARREATSVAVLFLDLDRFKIVNDSMGHAAGDVLLREAAHRLRQAVRPSDSVARLGGDEFVVVCDELASGAEALTVAQRLLGVLSQPVNLEGREVVVTTSVGIAVGRADASAEALLHQADSAMYQAKAKGRNRIEAYDEELEERALERLDTEQDLRRAIDRGQLRVWYQPQYSLPCLELEGAEALVRWDHPERGILGPDQFLAVAEETGLIRDVGAFVLEEACRVTGAWAREHPGFTLSVNLSARQLETPHLSTFVAQVLDRHQLPAGRLCFEVTESILMDIRGSAARQLGQLRALGARLALDDFGTGYSSLSYLTSFPVDEVKVDRSFVADVGEGTRAAAVVSAVIGLAHRLGMRVVAEGAETAEQVQRLSDMGCDAVQGYHLGQPMTVEQVAVLMAPSGARQGRP